MDVVALGVSILFDPVFAFLSVPLLLAHPSNQMRTTILIAAALAAVYAYRSPDRAGLAPADMLLGPTHAGLGARCFMLALRVVLVLSAVLCIAGFNAGTPRPLNLRQMLATK